MKKTPIQDTQNSKILRRGKNQYHPVPSSPLFFPFGFMDIILCPGNVSSVIEDSKIPEIDRFPSIWNESYPSSNPLHAAHSLDSRGDVPSPRSHHRVTTIACRKCSARGSARSSVNLISTRYSDGHSGQRRMGRHFPHRVAIELGLWMRRAMISLARCSRPCRAEVSRGAGT